MEIENFFPGLRGVVAGETEICRIDGGLQYRGYCIHDLSERSSFLEIAYLLLFDDLPSEDHFVDFLSVLHEEQTLPSIVLQVYAELPAHTSALSAMRTGIGLLSHFDPQPNEELMHAGPDQVLRIMARLPLLLGAWHRIRSGKTALEPRMELSYVANLYYLINGEAPSALQERSLEVAMITAMEHEFTPSSFTARCIGSTSANMYGAILGALEAFIGIRHGGGDDLPLDVLDAVGRPRQVEDWVAGLPEHAIIPGFGHSIYRECDPRAAVLELVAGHLARACGRNDLENMADAIERAVWQHRQIPPNIDWPWCRVMSYLGFSRDLFRAIFMVARTVGWAAHTLEQCESNEVIRPRARYRGAEDCHFEPLRHRMR
ncbi:MAG: hypothetical protein KDA66_04250 [Planctomycetaceae bacterium]|nr:hypothetical protein [Planctomycetaceae bacterium]